MNRSFLMSALVLALAAAACGGGAAEGDGAKDPSGEKKDEASSGDAIADLKSSIDSIQKEIDGLFEPINNADAVIQGVADLPKELKAAKSKVDPKKLMAEAAKLVEGGEINLDALKLEDTVKAKVTGQFDKLKALVQSIKDLPEKVKAIPAKFEALPGKLPAAVLQAGKSAAKAKLPFGVSDADKKKAEEDMKTVEGFKTDLPKKVEGWKKSVTDVPAKAAGLPAKMKAAFK